MNKIFTWAVMLLPLLLTACTTQKGNTMKPLETVHYVDLSSYAGQWYEIARYPNSFQKGCVGSRATYTLRDDGRLTVVNECYDKSLTGRLRSVKGKAWTVDKGTNAWLKVSFFWPFAGDYWIIDLGREYEYAVIGHPERKYLWILSRSPKMAEEVYHSILMRLQRQDYDTTKLIRTEQEIR